MSQETTVRVPLRVEDLAQRAEAMAGIIAEIEAIEAAAKEKP